jgi:PAS domain S-box-containing protein
VVPVMRGEKVKAILGVGNKPTDYTDKDVEALTLLADLIWEIAERKQAEQQVTQMSFALNGIHEAAFMVDEDARIKYVNDETCRILGYSRDALLAMKVPDITPEYSIAQWSLRWSDLKEQGASKIERQIATRDGRVVSLEVNTSYFEYEGRGYVLGLARDITERKQAERERLANLMFFESMDRVNRSIQAADDLESMMRDLLDVVLSIFDCHRAFLMVPCDPEAPTLYGPMERNKPEYPGVRELGGEHPMDPQVAAALRVLLAADGPVTFGPGLQHTLPEDVSKQFGIKSVISMAIYPKTGSPWQFGIQQCDRARIWMAEEVRMFEAVGRRLADGLSSLLSYRDLRRNEEFLDNIVEHFPHMVFVKDAQDLRFVRFNQAGERLLGYSREELLGKTDYDFFPKEMADFFTDKDRQVLQTKALVDIAEETIRNRSNEKRLLHTKKIPILDETGTPQYLLGISEDITGRKRAEEKMHRSDQRLRLHSEQSPLGFLEWDDHFRAVEWNAACERIFGYSRDEAMGRHAKDLIFPVQVHELVDGIYQNLMRQTGGQHSINENVTKDGRIIVCEWFNTTLINKDGKAIGVASVCRDITKQKRLEEELARHREHLEEQVKKRTAELEIARNKAQQYLDIAGVMLVAIDKNRSVALINQKGCEVLQGTSAEIIGKDWFDTFVPQNQRQEVLRRFEQVMAGELEPMEYFENSVLTQDGRERLVAWHNVLLRDDEGHTTGTLSSGEDITERRGAEKQIISLNQDLRNRALALEAANKELDAFAYTVSHDLRAPLRHIDGFLELLQKETGTALNEKSRHYMDTISKAAKKMGLLIDDLLSFSRMGRYALSFGQVALGTLVSDVVRELEPDATGRTIEWRINDLPSVKGDERMLRIVLTNLIANALKFTRTRPQARIEIGSLPDQDSESVIFVRDNGVGFNMAYAQKLFGVFQRLHRADDFEGTGIGLASVRRIIARHGGRTWAQGEPDRGAAFFFTLPRT